MKRNLEICRRCIHLGRKYKNLPSSKPPIHDEYNCYCDCPRETKPEHQDNWTFSDYDAPDECIMAMEHLVMEQNEKKP